MADRPITFSGAMVRALLAGTKTQTRRVITKPGLLEHGLLPSGTGGIPMSTTDMGFILYQQPRYQIGDRLYVREHWRTWQAYDALAPRDLSPDLSVQYEAGQEEPWPDLGDMAGKFRQAMHMPKWASRITLHVTEVRVQRLQEISEEDAKAEGIVPNPVSGRYFCGMDEVGPVTSKSPITAYAWLWNSINGEDAWMQNPWVTATSFEVERCHIDQARAA